eukprot:gene8951-900_t
MHMLRNTSLGLKEYQKLINQTIESISDQAEEIIEESNMEDYDIVLSEGVLQIQISKVGTYVISRQTPSRELWLSSPRSGPWHYKYNENEWICTREGENKFYERMNEEFSKIFNKTIKFEQV